jgi:sulfate adenylyltransferase subunit 2
LWSIYNTKIRMGEHIRVLPLSSGPSWTSGSIARENLEIPSIYFAHPQRFRRDGMLLSTTPHPARRRRPMFETTVRYRTVGDMTCTGAVGRPL